MQKAKAEQALAKAQAEIAEKQKQEKLKPAEPVAKIQKHSLSLIRNQLKVEKNFT